MRRPAVVWLGVLLALLLAALVLPAVVAGGRMPSSIAATSATLVLLAGFVLGMKHALEADHLVAISTIVTEQASLLRAAAVGGFWGLGHTSSLFLAALLVIVLRVQIPDRVALGMEFTVALMLIGLGLRAVYSWRTHERPVVPLSHIGRRPYFVGLVHGMAGSAALMLLVLTTISSPWLALLYVLLFGFGSVAGMLIMSVLFSYPLHFTVRRQGGMVSHIRLAAGLVSVAFGAFLSWQIGYVEGLFR